MSMKLFRTFFQAYRSQAWIYHETRRFAEFRRPLEGFIVEEVGLYGVDYAVFPLRLTQSAVVTTSLLVDRLLDSTLSSVLPYLSQGSCGSD